MVTAGYMWPPVPPVAKTTWNDASTQKGKFFLAKSIQGRKSRKSSLSPLPSPAPPQSSSNGRARIFLSWYNTRVKGFVFDLLNGCRCSRERQQRSLRDLKWKKKTERDQ